MSQPTLANLTEQVSIALNYLNWDITPTQLSGKDYILDDFIAEVDLTGIHHQQLDKKIWVNILFQKAEGTGKLLEPILMEVTATEGLKDTVVKRQDVHQLNQKDLANFLENTKKFFELFALDFYPSTRSSVDRLITYSQNKKILHIDDSRGIEKTSTITPDEKQQEIQFILNYLGLTKKAKVKINFFNRARAAFQRLFRTIA